MTTVMDNAVIDKSLERLRERAAAEGLLDIVFRLVDRCVGRGIDNEVRSVGSDSGRQGFAICNIDRGSARHMDNVAARQAFPAERLRHLTMLADDENSAAWLRH